MTSAKPKRRTHLDADSTAISVEAERRIGRDFKAIFEARFQDKIGDGDPYAAAMADEDFFRFRLAYYF